MPIPTFIEYDEPLFRPPGEAGSAILQVTLGCSWNKCAFCEMYTSKSFRIRKLEEIKSDINVLANSNPHAKKIFLADGDSFVLSHAKLIPILEAVNKKFSNVRRVSAYAMPRNILDKTSKQLEKLRSAGLKLLYIGIETGDDRLLKALNKGETSTSTIEGIRKAHAAGIDTSVMILNGLGGKKFSSTHARESARVINAISPKYLSTLTLSFPFGFKHFKNRFEDDYQQQSMVELFEELKLFVEDIEADHLIFRSDHVSNNLILKGVLQKDKKKIIDQLTHAIAITPEDAYPSSPGIL